jgi:hypothetical protein
MTKSSWNAEQLASHAPVAGRVLLISDSTTLQYRSANRKASRRFFISQMPEPFGWTDC